MLWNDHVIRLVNSQRARDWLLQVLFVGAILAVLVTVIVIAIGEMKRKGVASGFAFLWRSTGWDIGFSILDYSIRDPYWWALSVGLLNTIVVGYSAILAASLLGLVIAMMRMSGNPIVRGLSVFYIDIIRNVPPILQVFIWYAVFTALPRPRDAFVLGDVYFSARGVAFPSFAITSDAKLMIAGVLLVAIAVVVWTLVSKTAAARLGRWKRPVAAGVTGLGLLAAALIVGLFRIPDVPFIDLPRLKGFGIAGGTQVPPEVSTIFFAMMVYGSAYIAEVVRAGFMAVPKGQFEAGKALGLSWWQIFRNIQLPLAFRYMLPALVNQYVWLIKATTLGVAVGFADLFLVVSSSINQIGHPIELMGILVVVFWIMSHGMAAASNRLNESLRSRS
jgi:His/Glu/Gln/Arg/opine family amino acid ABC transporter permease subunit